MGYIQQSLGRDERLIYRAHFHWLYGAAAWTLLLLSVAAALGAGTHDYPRWLPWTLIACGVLLFLAIKLPIWAQQIAVTNQRLIHRRGLVRRSTEEMQLRAVEEVRLEQGILGRILGFGRIVVSGTGVEDIRLPALAEPVRLRRKLQEAIAAATRPVAA
jgi:Bacterial PH domain